MFILKHWMSTGAKMSYVPIHTNRMLQELHIFFRSPPHTPDIKVYMDICIWCSFTLQSSRRSSSIKVFSSYLIFFLHSFLIDFEHLCIGRLVWCWMDCMAPEYLTVRLVICIWIIYLVQCVLARPTSQSDSDGWLQQQFVSVCPPVSLFFEQCFSFSFFFCMCFVDSHLGFSV